MNNLQVIAQSFRLRDVEAARVFLEQEVPGSPEVETALAIMQRIENYLLEINTTQLSMELQVDPLGQERLL